MLTKWSIGILVMMVLGACASTPQVRDLAKQTSALTQGYAASVKKFEDAQADLSAKDNARIAYLNSAAREAGADVEPLVLSWTLGDRKAELARYQAASAVSPADIIASMRPGSTPGAVKLPDVKLEDAAKTLAGIAEKPSLIDQAAFLGGFAGAVQKGMQKLQEEAAKKAEAASKKATDDADDASKKTDAGKKALENEKKAGAK